MVSEQMSRFELILHHSLFILIKYFTCWVSLIKVDFESTCLKNLSFELTQSSMSEKKTEERRERKYKYFVLKYRT
jgi:hypothetical protein